MPRHTWIDRAIDLVDGNDLLPSLEEQQELDCSKTRRIILTSYGITYMGKTYTRAFNIPELPFEDPQSLTYPTMNQQSQFLTETDVCLNRCMWKSTSDDIFRGRSQECQCGHIDFELEIEYRQSDDWLESSYWHDMPYFSSLHLTFSPSRFSPEYLFPKYCTIYSEHCGFPIPHFRRDWLMGWNYERLHYYPVEPWLQDNPSPFRRGS